MNFGKALHLMRIYLFIRWVAWDLWWSDPFISLPLNVWAVQIMRDPATLLSLSNLNKVSKPSSSLWVVSLPTYLPGGKQHEPLCVQPMPGSFEMCSLRRAGRALAAVLHFWNRCMLGRSAEVFHACGDLSGSKGLSCCSGQLCPVVWLLKFSNWVWLSSVC